MSLPRIAIVGRPNVGKSSLLNMLAKTKVSIVDPTPGVTRDRVTAVVELTGPEPNDPVRLAEVTDTGGYGVYTAEGGRFDDAGEDLSRLTDQIETQIGAAVDRADLILFVIDAQDGVMALDRTIAGLLRRRDPGKGRDGENGRREPVPIRVVANKVDADNWEASAPEAAELGFGEPLIVSAKTNFRRRDFIERLWEIVPEVKDDGTPDALPEMRIALVGRRNAGKSTFVNALAGEERCIVSEIPGTTRDAIDVRFELDGKTLLAIDTAGVRRRTKFADAIEHFAFMRAQAAVRRSDVVLMLLDATQEIAGIDQRLGRFVQDEYKPCVIVVTKWDLAEGRKTPKGQTVTMEDYREYIEKELPGLRRCPIVFTSGIEGRGVRDTIGLAFDLFEQSRLRVTTSKLNEFLRGIFAQRGPSTKLGTKVKVLYVSQISIQPPTILAVVNRPELFTPEYERYLLNRFHEELPFTEVPIRLIIRGRQRADEEDGTIPRRKRGGGKRPPVSMEIDANLILPVAGGGADDGDDDLNDDE
ncbi:MAG TPA: ribosome biogenesis GTPase Der [Phycisphaerales bacterium]|nr:ribosome biogenesis GTPase Der [Phycisphaerales bacterium]